MVNLPCWRSIRTLLERTCFDTFLEDVLCQLAFGEEPRSTSDAFGQGNSSQQKPFEKNCRRIKLG